MLCEHSIITMLSTCILRGYGRGWGGGGGGQTQGGRWEEGNTVISNSKFLFLVNTENTRETNQAQAVSKIYSK